MRGGFTGLYPYRVISGIFQKITRCCGAFLLSGRSPFGRVSFTPLPRIAVCSVYSMLYWRYMSPENSFKDKVQLVSYLVTRYNNDGRKPSVRRIMNMLFLADVYTMRNYGVCITDDTYFATENGPVPSEMDAIVEQNRERLSREQLEYTKTFLKRNSEKNDTSDTVEINRETDPGYLSELNTEAIDAVYAIFRDREADELIKITRAFHAWKRHEEALKKEGRVEMDIEDLFDDTDGVLQVTEEILRGSKYIYGTV